METMVVQEIDLERRGDTYRNPTRSERKELKARQIVLLMLLLFHQTQPRGGGTRTDGPLTEHKPDENPGGTAPKLLLLLLMLSSMK